MTIPPTHSRDKDDLAYLSPIEDIIEDARNGRMYILIDDENRENEGDLVIPAQMATPENINFMAKYGRGLICLSFTQDDADRLGLNLMPRSNVSRFGTNFTVSIEAREGVTTGISASDRARTIATAIHPHSTANDIATPGHIFPLVAREGGVLMRAGHTEAAVDISTLAGLNASGVICEIMNDDGEMMRLSDLIPFARHHGLKIGCIADLIAYRRRKEQYVKRQYHRKIILFNDDDFDLHLYKNTLNNSEHIAITKGDVTTGKPILVRMHMMNLLKDMIGVEQPTHGWELQNALRTIADEGCGAVIILSPGDMQSGLASALGFHESKNGNGDDNDHLRDYGTGAQILSDLQIKNMILMSNSNIHVVGLDGYDIHIVETRRLR